MSQDNPEAGDVFATPKVGDYGYLVYYLIKDFEGGSLKACWFTNGAAPALRPCESYPQPIDKFLCNLNKLFRSIEEKLEDAATDH